MQRRILMVALDGLDFGLVERAYAAGRLPNIRAFAEASRELRVRSDGETIEGSVWPTFTTGTGPGTHGHHWFYQWIPAESRFAAASHPDFAVEPFWKTALEAGRRVIEFDMPYTLTLGHPNERAYNGWGLQDEMAEFAHPASFRKEILRKHGRSKVQKDTLLVKRPEDRLRLARRLRSAVRQRCSVLLDLVRARDWELLIFGFGEFHLGGHHLALPMDLSPKVTNETAMYSILKPLDDAWPEIVAAAGEDCDVVLFALHGMQPKLSYQEAAQHILQEMEGRPPPKPAKPDMLRRLRNMLPERVHQAIWLRLPAEQRMIRMMNARLAEMDIHRDRAFVFEGDCSVAMRLNIEGREKYGVLPAEESRAFLDRLFEETKRYRTEEQLEPFVDIFVTAEGFKGERLDYLPDAALIYNPDVVRTRKLTRDDGFEIELFRPESRNGVHTGRGFAYYRAAGDATFARDEIDNQDFAPTVLQRLGVTPGAALEGAPFME